MIDVAGDLPSTKEEKSPATKTSSLHSSINRVLGKMIIEAGCLSEICERQDDLQQRPASQVS